MGELGSQFRVPYLVDVPDAFLGVPGVSYFSVGVTRSKEPLDTILTAVIDTFMGHDQQAADPVERIAFPTAVSQRFVLYPPAHQIYGVVGQPDHMKRICYLMGVGQHLVIGDLVGT